MIFKTKKELIGTLITQQDIVLDIGFWGQGIDVDHNAWPHKDVLTQAAEVFGVDLEFDPQRLGKSENYYQGNAENFVIPKKFTVILALDLIEHLSNVGLFLASCRKHLDQDGRLILATPNCFNLYNVATKIMFKEPVVNKDHTMYLNYKTIEQLLVKNGWRVTETHYLYAQKYPYKESWKKKILNGLYFLLSIFTDQYHETLVIVAKPNT